MWRGRPRPRLLKLILALLLAHPEGGATRASVALTHAGESPAATQTTQSTPTHFANTRAAGARFVVAAIVLLGSPPVAWLI